MKTSPPTLRDRARRPQARAGESDTTALIAALGILLVLALAGAGVWMFQSQRIAAVDAERKALRHADEQYAAAVREQERLEAEGDPARWTEGPLATRSEVDAANHAPGLPDPKRFDGTGRLRGQVTLASGGLPQDGFEVFLEPAAGRLGSEGAESRNLQVPAGENEFAFDELPLGSYDLRVRTDGLQGRSRAVMLVRGSEEVYLSVGLVGTGIITGEVLDHREEPVGDLRVILVTTASGVQVETRTDSSGYYRFDDVSDGEYRVHYGGLNSPIIDPIHLSFEAPRLSVPRTVLPETGQLTVECTDESGQILVGVHVQGYGNQGGRIDVETDREGRAVVDFLPLGTYTVIAREENIGEGRAKTHVYPGVNEPFKLVLAPR